MFVRFELAEDEELRELLQTWTDKKNTKSKDENLLVHTKRGYAAENGASD